MKKRYFLILFLFFVLLSGCTHEKVKTDEEILDYIANNITFEEEINHDLDLPSTYDYEDKVINAKWTSENENYLSNQGERFATEDRFINLTVELTLNDKTLTKKFELFILGISQEDFVMKILSLMPNIEQTPYKIELPKQINMLSRNYNVQWKSQNKDIANDNGDIIPDDKDRSVTFEASITYLNTTVNKTIQIDVPKFDTNILKNALDTIQVPNVMTTDNQTLVNSVNFDNHVFNVEWKSDKPDIYLPNNLHYVLEDTNITLTATITHGKFSESKNFNIVIKAIEQEQLMQNVLDDMIDKGNIVPNKITSDIFLPTDFPYNIKGSWTSSDETIITNEGKIQTFTGEKEIKLILELQLEGTTLTKEFSCNVIHEPHMFLDRTFNGEKENVIINNEGKLVLQDNALTGTYETGIIESQNFKEAVASWAAVTSTKATCELFVSVRVNNQWSDYITYGEWGLGLKNAAHDQNKNIMELSTDEIMIKNNATANAFQMKIVLKRKALTDESPIVSLLAITLDIPNYTFNVDNTNLPKKANWQVPELYQHDVPTIGNSICSATSSTMLLKFKGHDFTKNDPLEHEYIAGLVKDYGNNIYGNWVYNTVGMSAFGEIAYVKRFYSDNEVFYHLANVGPFSASIKGPQGNPVIYTSMKTNQDGQYTSNGHLIVVTGYEITDNQTYIYINDPNVRGVAIRMTLQNFKNVWRNVAYVIE